MSRILHDAVIQALKEAHAAYLKHNIEKYRDNMQVAECGVKAIRSLGMEDICGRQMELMGLEAEITLLSALECIHCPAELVRMYEKASVQMLMPPSRVISREGPMLPSCEDPLDFFGKVSAGTAEQLERAAELYGQLTGGGGSGVNEIYRARMAEQCGDQADARKWAQLALERMSGDKWIEPVANRIISKTDRSLIIGGVKPQYMS